jgi:metal-responsive CopG/Arc/MetJ family transcriptional regulator
MPRPSLGKVKYTATISPELLAGLDAVAQALGKTRSDVLEELVRKLLQRQAGLAGVPATRAKK